jgi:hypothetical protein
MVLRYKPTMSLRSLAAGAGLSALAMLAGCGDSVNDDAQRFLGVWHYDEASGVITCPGADPFNLPPEGNKTFAPSLTAGIVDVTVSPLDSSVFCNFAYDVKGLEAIARAGQTCGLTGGDSFSVSDAAVGEYAKLAIIGPTTLEELSIGTIHITEPSPIGGAPTIRECRYDVIGHLTKVAKD